MKNILDDVVTDDDVRFLIRQAKIRAADGDNEALRIILAYKYGMPTTINSKKTRPMTIHSKKTQPATSNGGGSTGGGKKLTRKEDAERQKKIKESQTKILEAFFGEKNKAES